MQKTHGFIIGLVLMVVGLVSPPAHADEMSFQSVNGVAYGGYYVSPYQAVDQTLGTTLQLYCLDFNHDVNFGEQWPANLYAMTQSNSVNYQYGANNYANPIFVTDPNDPNFTIWDRYQAVAWLFSQEGPSPSGRALGVYEYAAWQLFLTTDNLAAYCDSLGTDAMGCHSSSYGSGIHDVSNGHTFQQDVDAALTAAMNPANYGSVDLSKWDVVTPIPAGQTNSVQEFLTPITPVPEPSTVVPLVLSSLAGLIAYTRRRRG